MIRATLAAAALLYGAMTAHANAQGLDEAGREELRALAVGEMAKLVVHDAPRPPLEQGWTDGDGNPIALADYAGQVVVLNFWATWCPPCRAEMPSLDRLAGEMRPEGVAVIPLSSDKGEASRISDFLDEIGAEHLGIHHDRPGKVAREAAVLGLPATVLIDREGREVARMIGDAEWDSEEAKALIRRLVELTAPSELQDASAGTRGQG